MVAKYAYPHDLARYVHERWTSVDFPGDVEAAPKVEILEHFLSGCYHASMLREEERPVTFRAILAPPSRFRAEAMPPEGLLRLEFSDTLPFDPNELRRLSVVADPQRTLIGVAPADDGRLRVWGLVNSGARWLRDVRGGRRAGPSLPPVPVVYVHAPGRVEAYQGYELIGKLQGGTLTGTRVDVFESEWLPEEFLSFREEIVERHEAARQRALDTEGVRWAEIEPTLPRRIAERLHKRVISLLRDARHGGTILFVPSKHVDEICGDNPYIRFRYALAAGKARHSFTDLVVKILNRLGHVYGAEEDHTGLIGWPEFEATADEEIAKLDEALFEMANWMAGLAEADGAVVLTKHHELLGFGGMISGVLADVDTVASAQDLEADQVTEEETGNVGARHLSAYRLVGALPGALAIVISQDGAVRFVTQKRGHVTYWEQE